MKGEMGPSYLSKGWKEEEKEVKKMESAAFHLDRLDFLNKENDLKEYRFRVIRKRICWIQNIRYKM